MIRTERILKVDEVNLNRRLIPRHVVETFLESYDGEDIICTFAPSMDENVDMSKVSHKLKNLRLEGNYLCGDIEVLDTEYGKILTDCIESVSFPASFIGIQRSHESGEYAIVTSMKNLRCFVSNEGLAFH